MKKIKELKNQPNPKINGKEARNLLNFKRNFLMIWYYKK